MRFAHRAKVAGEHAGVIACAVPDGQYANLTPLVRRRRRVIRYAYPAEMGFGLVGVFLFVGLAFAGSAEIMINAGFPLIYPMFSDLQEVIVVVQ